MFTAKNKVKSWLHLTTATLAMAIAFQPGAIAQSLSKKLSVLSEIENHSLPSKVNRDVRVDSAFSGPGKVYGYNYTLINYSAAQIDGTEFARWLHPRIKADFCQSYLVGFFRQHNVSMEVRIYDRNRSLVGRAKISPNKCR